MHAYTYVFITCHLIPERLAYALQRCIKYQKWNIKMERKCQREKKLEM